jgi:hypothetical protein
LLEVLGNRSHSIFEIPLSVGSSKVREDGKRLRISLEDLLNGGNGGYDNMRCTLNSIRVDYFALLDGDVEVGPHQDLGGRIKMFCNVFEGGLLEHVLGIIIIQMEKFVFLG